jgi:hypothetical protein
MNNNCGILARLNNLMCHLASSVQIMSKILLEDYADFLVEIAPEVKEVLEATFQDAAISKPYIQQSVICHNLSDL